MTNCNWKTSTSRKQPASVLRRSLSSDLEAPQRPVSYSYNSHTEIPNTKNQTERETYGPVTFVSHCCPNLETRKNNREEEEELGTQKCNLVTWQSITIDLWVRLGWVAVAQLAHL